MIVQCFVTAWRVDHRRRPHRRRVAHRVRSTSRPRETREEARQRKYRYLYQVRTARGDIISQVRGCQAVCQCSTRTTWLPKKTIFNLLSSCVLSLTELCFCIAKTRPARSKFSIRTVNQEQLTRTKHPEQ